MVIQKVINNNVISAYDGTGRKLLIWVKESVLRRIQGDLIDEGRIEKVFPYRE